MTGYFRNISKVILAYPSLKPQHAGLDSLIDLTIHWLFATAHWESTQVSFLSWPPQPDFGECLEDSHLMIWSSEASQSSVICQLPAWFGTNSCATTEFFRSCWRQRFWFSRCERGQRSGTFNKLPTSSCWSTDLILSCKDLDRFKLTFF